VSHPIAFLNNIHYASLSDLSWSADGLILGITSSDGYCSFVKFDPEEFGPKLEGDELEVVMKPVWDARVVKESEPETPLKDGEKMDVDTPDVAAEGKADAMDTDDAPKSTHTAPAPGGAAKKPRKRIAPVAIAPSQSIATAAANAAPQAESTAAPTTTPAEPDAPATADSKQQRKRIQPTLLSFAGAGTTTPPEQAQPADAATTST
jgi:chromatin assembly factor 1 subunit B